MKKVFEFIPAIDLINGKCVRLSQGNYDQSVIYSDNPVEVAIRFEQLGIKRVHLVDLDGARNGRITNLTVLEEICKRTSLLVDFGGGIKSAEDISVVLQAGATWVTIGSMAVKNRELVGEWMQRFGTNKFFLGIDIKDNQVVTDAWLHVSDSKVGDVISYFYNQGFNHFFCTDTSKDGMLGGISTAIYENIIASFPGVHVYASGGVSECKDVETAREIGCSGIIVGKAIYEGKITNEEITRFIQPYVG